ncbi:MAG: hypothetical protein FWH21_07475 [Kiritimatiellaeota bacterium]|nr:hypothetical protein [Kiritimatiellota bacterium]
MASHRTPKKTRTSVSRNGPPIAAGPPPVLRLIGLRNTGYVEAGGRRSWGSPRPPGAGGASLRAAGAHVFTIFNYDRHAEPTLPLLRLGATKER